jgi:glucose dehydrogenase
MLLSDRGGLFSTYPVALIAVVGLVFTFRRDRAWAFAAIVVLFLQWRVNASIFDWYQVRRFTGTFPLIALGLVAVAPALARAGLLVCACLVVLVHQYDVAIDALRPLPGTAVPVRAALGEMSDSIASPVYEGLQTVAPRTAVAFLEG